MKNKITIVLLTFLGHTLVFSQNFILKTSNEENIVVDHKLANAPLVFDGSAYISIDSENYYSFSKTHKIVSKKIGEPAIPFYTESVIVADKGEVSLLVTHEGYEEYSDVLIAPSKGSLKRNVLPTDIPHTFSEVYSTNAFYPGDLAEITSPFALRNTRGVTIIVNPYQYNPVTKTLRVYKNIRVKIKMDKFTSGINEIESRAENITVYRDIYSSFYLNTVETLTRYTPKDEEGDMLIISGNSYLDEMESFVEWKTQEGIKTTIVSMSDVGASDTDVLTYIENFYTDNPDLIFVLLVGDHNTVPSHTYGLSGSEELWSDSYYGQMTGDFYPELFVGRFSGNNSEIETMVKRTLEYEKTPTAGNWMANAIGLASEEGDGYGDDGEVDWLHARNNRAKLLGYGYIEVFEFYDGSHGGEDAAGDPNAIIINEAVESGVGLFNYTGHGDEFTCVTGNYSSADINAANNQGKYPFVVSVACNNGTFTTGTCISETWLRAKNGSNPTGAIAACGSTILMAWAEPMQTQDEMADIIAETYVTNRKATVGGIFYNAQMSMFEEYGASATAEEVMQTWIMFGDPSVLFRNKETVNMVVAHVSNVPLATSSISVNCDIEDAKVAIVQNNVIIGTEKVVDGVAVVSFDALATDDYLIVTVTKQNHKPYQAVVTVADGAASISNNEQAVISIYPNPSSNQFTVDWGNTEMPSLIELHDLTGKTVYQSVPVNGNKEVVLTNELAKGVYLLILTVNGAQQATKLIIK